MRAYEFIKEEHQISSSQPITIRNLHAMKLAAKRAEIAHQERLALMQIMYADPETQQQKFEHEKQRFELEQLRAELDATKSETENKSAIALHHSAKEGLKSKQQSHQHLTRLAKSGLGR